MTPTELRELVTTMRELGVASLKSGDLAIELGPVMAALDAPPMKGNGKATAAYLDKMLYAASEGLPLDDDEGQS